MAIKIEMLRCFRAVVSHGSLAEAAENLGRTPSAVSMMLKQFESHIGAPLFESARKSRLTPLGELVHAEASRELVHFDRTIAAIEGLSRAELGHVCICVTPSVAQTIMPPILKAFLRKHPGVRLDMSDTDSLSVRRELTEERADIGLASLGPLQGFDRQLLFSDRFGVVCPADHPLARDWDELTWRDLTGIDFVANGLCDQIRDEAFLPILSNAHLMVRNTASILSLVRAGVGVTILPELTVSPEFSDLVFLPLTDSTARREVWMFTQPPHVLTPVAKSLATAIAQAKITSQLQ